MRRIIELSPYSQYRTGVIFKIVKNRHVPKKHKPIDQYGNCAFEKEFLA
jgi:hypothetical protein